MLFRTLNHNDCTHIENVMLGAVLVVIGIIIVAFSTTPRYVYPNGCEVCGSFPPSSPQYVPPTIPVYDYLNDTWYSVVFFVPGIWLLLAGLRSMTVVQLGRSVIKRQ